jgi:glycosyltransferase involved in cell wall biosynthesis
MAYDQLPENEVRDGVHIFRIDAGRKKPNMSYPREHLRFLKNGRKFLSKHLQAGSYDVVHCHFILSTGILAHWVKKKFGIPYIITSHGSDLPGFNPDRFQAIHLITPFFIRRILNRCQFVVSPSNYLGGLIEPHLKDKNKLVIIPNGIEDDALPSAKADIILSTGRLLERKGFHTLVEAVRNIEIPYEVHICGDGPMMSHLKELALSSKTKIIFHGWMNNSSQEYQQLLAKARIYVLVSEFENASISLLEAMINSCAIITSNTSGCPETVGEIGICIEPNNSKSLEKAILSLINDADKTLQIGKQARKRATTNFSWTNIAEAYEDTLKAASKQ